MKNGSDWSRRRFTKSGAAALVTLISGIDRSKTASPSAGEGPRRSRLSMLIDLERCIGCHACSVACKAEHGSRLGGFRSWVSEREEGTYPAVKRHFLPRLCNHCANPPCEKVCPTGATFIRSDGLVDIDKNKCIGCRHCMGACPYNARYFNSQPGDESESRFGARTHGTVDKCDFCASRIDSGGEPACVSTCPTGARQFGDLNEPSSQLSRRLSSTGASSLLPELGTRPAVFYLGGKAEVFRRE